MTFLEAIAKDIIEKYGTDLSRTIVVFPNKRASLFLNEYLVKTLSEKSKETTPNYSPLISNCLWAPQYTTISDLFRKFSKLIVADHIKLVVELYKVYIEVTGRKNETLDEFYSWGELLLSDFDDLDKNEADPIKVFQNTADLHSFDTDEFLSKDQKEVLKRFFINFTDNHESELKKRFAELWNHLGDIYQRYHEVLREQGIAYEGMLYRDVVESAQLSTLHSQLSTLNSQQNVERYLFVGFNLLQKVEQDLFSLLIRENGNVKFYWDYDEYYCNSLPIAERGSHEAGQYIKQYLPKFPNELPSGELFTNFDKPKDISYISASTEDMQARYVSEWLTPERISAGKRTAIVLCNENLLPTIINCLPNEVEHVNITSGYPLTKTQIYSLIRQYLSLHLMGKTRNGDKFRLHIVNNILRHPYMQYISPKHLEVQSKLNNEHIFFPSLDDIAGGDDNLKQFFSPVEASSQTTQEETLCARNLALCNRLMWITKTIAVELEKKHKESASSRGDLSTGKIQLAGSYESAKEALYRTYTLFNRLHSLIENDGLAVDTMTFQRLIMQIAKTTTVPFHGEPIIGIQIMGVLETRNLDFDHVLLLSCNEGNLPKGVNDSSFIPHAIRKAYGLTTVDNKVAIYAYYFHRLLQRASDIDITYNSSTEDGQTGEKSRFMIQLQAESNLNIKLKAFSSNITPATTQINEIEKDDAVMNAIMSLEKLSPSALNCYLRCPLVFYYKVLCGFKDEDDEDEALFDNMHFGDVFHKAMELIYRPLLNQNLTESIIEFLIKDKRKINDAVDAAIMIKIFKFEETSNKAHDCRIEDVIDLKKMPQLNGSQLIIRKVIRRLVEKTLEYDKKHTPLIIRGVEQGFGTPISFEANGEQRTIKITGFIDRKDELQGPDGNPLMRIVDYKTGSRTPSITSVEEIFDPTKIEKHSDYYLQTMLYSIVTSAKEHKRVAPSLLYPSKVHTEGYNPILTFGSSRSKELILDSAKYLDEFSALLKTLISDIFNKEKPFTPTETTKRCEKCFFANLCK